MAIEIRPDKIPTCIQELKWFHPLIDNCESAEGTLMISGESGQYLLRPSSNPDVYTLSVRTKTSVKHFQIIVTSNEITFGLAKFRKFTDFLEHFESKPLIAGATGEPVLLKTPLLVAKHKTYHELARVHGLMYPTISRSPDNNMDPSVKSGFLIKQGGFIKSWKERWCIADARDLKYYQKADDNMPKGVIDLRDCIICRKTITSAEASGKDNTFVLSTPWRTFLFSAATTNDMESWITYIKDKLEIIKKSRG